MKTKENWIILFYYSLLLSSPEGTVFLYLTRQNRQHYRKTV